MYKFYQSPKTLDEALALKAKYGADARIVAGATDLLIELDRGLRQTPSGDEIGLIDISNIPGLADISVEKRGSNDWIELGPLVTHNQCVANPTIVEKAFPLARACWEVGAPQIRNRATIAGNIVTASPANDTIAPLIALGAEITVTSIEQGQRILPLADFLMGFRRVDITDEEILTGITFPAMDEHQRGVYIKLGLRRAQAISVVSVAIVLEVDPISVMPLHAKWAGDATPLIKHATIALGAVAPTIVQAKAAEAFLVGKQLTDDTIDEAAALALEVATPIDDVRASGEYRRHMVKSLVARGLRQIRHGHDRAGWAESPITLWGKTGGMWPVAAASTGEKRSQSKQPQGKQPQDKQPQDKQPQDKQPQGKQPQDKQPQRATVNGQAIALLPQMTLLDSLRDAGFVGVKEGCAEGECGSCTVYLDGMAVMACMVPSERAQGSQVVTVEGLRNLEQLHPVQQAFVDSGGVQCGYCTPGFVMSAAKLLEERPQPTRSEVQEALTGNLCRCTGYRKIIDAVVMAGEKQA